MPHARCDCRLRRREGCLQERLAIASSDHCLSSCLTIGARLLRHQVAGASSPFCNQKRVPARSRRRPTGRPVNRRCAQDVDRLGPVRSERGQPCGPALGQPMGSRGIQTNRHPNGRPHLRLGGGRPDDCRRYPGARLQQHFGDPLQIIAERSLADYRCRWGALSGTHEGGPPNKRIKLMRRRSAVLWNRCAHSLSAVRWTYRGGEAHA
jgi:hypothetical protein